MQLENKNENLINILDAGSKVFGINGSEIDRNKIKDFVVPEQIKDEIPTLNRFGYMKIALDEYSADFIQHASNNDNLVLEVGCAYGFVVQKVLENKGRIIACDVSAGHLLVLLKQTPQEYLKNLYLYQGEFPYGATFPAESLGAVLISRVLHFLRGEDLQKGLDIIHSWLISGGKFYFTAVSPYHNAVKEKFLHIYQQRFNKGDKWPGVIENHWEVAPQHEPFVQNFLNVFDIPQLEKLLPEHGFKIDRISLFDYPNDTDSGGKGHVGFVATKI